MINTITIEPNTSSYCGKMFDLLNDSAGGYLNDHLRSMKNVSREDWTSIPLVWLSRNPWKAVEGLLIDAKEMKAAAAYECPSLEQTFYAAIPIYLFAAGEAQEIRNRYGAINSHYASDLLLDKDWQQMILSNRDGYPLDSFQIVAMGPGYTEFFMPNDGSGSVMTAHVALSNGDLLIVSVWHWFNK